MNLKLEVLNPIDHKNLVYRPQNSYLNTAKRVMAPLLFSEFIQASRSYPILFSLSEGDERLVPMALLGLETTRGNLFLTSQGEWQENHLIPASLACYPFYPGPIDERGKMTLLIDRNAPHFDVNLSPEEGQPLFSPSGEATDLLKSIRKKLVKYQKALGQTDWVVYKLYEQNLFHSKHLADLVPGESLPVQTHNFFLLDPAKLNDLPDDYFLELRQQGMLANIYALVSARHNFKHLSNRANRQDQPKTQPETAHRILPQKSIPQEEAKKSPIKLPVAIAWVGLALVTGVIANYVTSYPKPTPAVSEQSDFANRPTQQQEATPLSLPEPTEEQETQQAETTDSSHTTFLGEKSLSEQGAEVMTDSKPQENSTLNSSAAINLSTPIEPPDETHGLLPDEAAIGETDSAIQQPEYPPLAPPPAPQAAPQPEPTSQKPSQEGSADEQGQVNMEHYSGTAPEPMERSTPPGEEETTPPAHKEAATEIPAGVEGQIAVLVDGVKRNITESRLTRPWNDNAMRKIEKIKALSPENPLIKELENTVFERFLELAIWDRTGNAKLYLERARKMFPGDPRITEIEQLIAE
ncbi:MAG: SapC family protein [Magnetococcales bacterium]|nr:SapC family protein [Magnetococcales bacterium]